ncbi:hypothetical protein [Sinosporangium album]|uniref:hypothetical protein n=1 Tax=Sinosporangium album TaxID=504805 RepID=UPI0015A22A83|nr:hypothetical protein [Sinosporangium album]
MTTPEPTFDVPAPHVLGGHVPYGCRRTRPVRLAPDHRARAVRHAFCAKRG